MDFKNYNYYKEEIKKASDILKVIMKDEAYSFVSDCYVSFSPSKEPIPFSQINNIKFKELKVGKSWGELFSCSWMKVEATLKTSCDLHDLFINFDCNGEALLYSDKGVPLKGFTNGSSAFDRDLSEPGKEFYSLDGLVKDNKICLLFDCGCNDLFGNLQENGVLKTARVVRKNELCLGNCYSFEVLIDYINTLTYKDENYDELFDGIIKVRDLYWYHHKDRDILASKILEKLLNIKGANEFSCCCLGHAHLDLVWLWPERESKRKILRTMTNVFYLLEKYKGFTYVISQPKQMEWLKEGSPELFEKLKKYIKEGRIETVGGSYVENDTNIIPEESLARQMLVGQKFLLDNFGHYSSIYWLPDTFGYNGNIPQICKLSNQQYFVSIKLSWNKRNKFPYHNFNWEGIDGSKVLVHLPFEGTYNSGAYPHSVKQIENNFYNTDLDKSSMVIYGIGDGGGGPGEDHVERILRSKNINSLPKEYFGNALSYMDKLDSIRNKLPNYKGELYLENHQGTYTSQSNIKKYNRLIDEKLKRVEWLLVNLNNNEFDDEIKNIWKRQLFMEFHDLLPGSSIKRVYDEALMEYAKIDRELDSITNKLIKDIGYKEGSYVLNHLNYPITKLYKTGEKYYEVKVDANSSSNSFKKFAIEEDKIDQYKIKTNIFEIRFSKKGYIESIIDLRNHVEMVENYANKLRVYVDQGDAWNIEDSYRDQDEVLMELKEHLIKKYGDIYEVNNVYIYNNSKVIERIIVKEDSDIIDVHHDVDWHDEKRFLKSNSAFSVETDKAICDIQFGTVERTRKNGTLQEKAQFEICAQNFVDISSKDYGVALINKAKCGYYVKGHNLELSLLRSTCYPCIHGDIGKTSYNYAFYIHNNNYEYSDVDRIAYIYNSNFFVTSKQAKLDVDFKYKNDDIEYSCYKRSYDGKGTIVRLYERSGIETNLNLDLVKRKKLFLVNILEDEIEEITEDSLKFEPFEIKTIMVK